MPLDLLIAGAGGAGLKVLQILEDQSADGDGQLRLIGFLDDCADLWGSEFFGYPVFGPPEILPKIVSGKRVGIVSPIGDPVNRGQMIDRLMDFDVEFPCVIHPSAQISRRAKVGCGNVFSQNVVIQAGAKIGDFNTFNIAAILGPLAQVRNFCTVNANVMLASGSLLNDYCYMSMGTNVMQRTDVAEGTLAGANAFVNKPTEPWTTVVGLPAKTIKRRQSPWR